ARKAKRKEERAREGGYRQQVSPPGDIPGNVSAPNDIPTEVQPTEAPSAPAAADSEEAARE
ncbi:MAG: hypothetical protein IIZ25_04510, partial [Thermoguttaceae bacterium]|nr:hypothetical protein [Thermoguttaceae bacterium]